MPRLYHQKSTSGCLRCKRRKVKCDEGRPACGACTKHNLPCQYPSPAATSDVSNESAYFSASSSARSHRSILPVSSANADTTTRSTDAGADNVSIRLFHYFLTRTTNMFMDDSNFWRTRTPLVAFDHRFVYDAIIALAAIDLYRQTYELPPVESAPKEITTAQTSRSRVDWMISTTDDRLYLAGRTSNEMRQISSHYFHLAIEGQRQVLQDLTKEKFEPAFIASVLISTAAIFFLGLPEEGDGDGDGDPCVIPLNESLWFRLADGTRELWAAWTAQAGSQNVLEDAGYFRMEYDLSNKEQMFHPDHRKVFEVLLQWASEFEHIAPDELQVYEQAVSFIGVLFKVVRDEYPAVVSSAMVLAFPAYMEPPFQRLVLEGRPRALAIIAHIFAITRLLEKKIPWYKGIAARQIPSLYARLPLGWQKVMKWPMAVLERAHDSLGPIPEPPSLEDLA